VEKFDVEIVDSGEVVDFLGDLADQMATRLEDDPDSLLATERDTIEAAQEIVRKRCV